MSAPDGWPFRFDRARFDALSAYEQGMVERAALEEIYRIQRERQRIRPRLHLVKPPATDDGASNG